MQKDVSALLGHQANGVDGGSGQWAESSSILQMRKLSQRAVTLQGKRQESSFSLGYTDQTGMPPSCSPLPLASGFQPGHPGGQGHGCFRGRTLRQPRALSPPSL